jgi:GAF domain-containing protein
LIITATTLGNFVSLEELEAFCDRYHPLPVVSIGVKVPDVPSVIVDNEAGVREAVAHLIEDHGYRRIAFIRGPEGHVEAEARFRAYREGLEAHGVPFDDQLVAPGDFVSSAPGLRLLLDERGVEFDAVMTANDNMALRAIEELRTRGFRVPEDVAVIGFDDISESRFSTPPLTTIRQPIERFGAQAADLILSMVRGEAGRDVLFPSELVVRRSCGCLNPDIVKASAREILMEAQGESADREPDAEWSVDRLVTAVRESVPVERLGIGPERLVALVRTLVDALDDADNRLFLVDLDNALYQAVVRGVDLQDWQAALSALRRALLAGLLANQGGSRLAAHLALMEDMLGQGRLMVSAAAQREQALKRTQSEHLSGAVREVGLDLLAAFDLDHLTDVLVDGMMTLGMRSCYLVLFHEERDVAPADRAYTATPEYADLVLAYRDRRRLELSDGASRPFPSQVILPRELLAGTANGEPARRYNLVVEPLTFEEQQLGIALFEPGPWEGSVYTALRGQLSSALQGALLTDEMSRRTAQLQTAAEVSRIVGRSVDQSDMLQSVVDLIRERLSLYYVGVFLVDTTGAFTGDPGRWAVLQAGTGEAGRQMVEQRHRLEVGGTSMVGWSIEHQEGRITQDVSQETVRRPNPLLPETQSEMALPMIGRAGDALGALTIQSVEPEAFSEADIAVLQTIADQLAGAVENLSLLEQTQAALVELEATQRRYQQRAWQDYLTMTRLAGFDLGAGEAHELDVLSPEEEVLPEVQTAIARKQATILAGEESDGEDRSALVVPITYRGGAVIGALGIHDDAARQWSEDEVALVEAVVERMGLAAENLRLLDETQRRVATEQLTQDVTARMRESLDIESVLRAAVQGFVDAFDVDEVNIRMVDSPAVRLDTVDDAGRGADDNGSGEDGS